jgi:hypothetical protein
MIKLELTPQGQDAARQLPDIGAAVLNEQLRGFTADDLATLIDLLGRLIANGIDPDSSAGCGLCSPDDLPDETLHDSSPEDGKQ